MIVICCCQITELSLTRPEPSPPANCNTSSILTMLKSPSIECFKQLAATENSIIDFASYPSRLVATNPAPKLSPPPTLSTICILYLFEK